jgi:transposase
MSKYSLDFKLSAISKVINQSCSILSVSRELNVRKSNIFHWVNLFIQHGINGLTPKKITYSGDFKLRVLNCMYEQQISLTQTAILFGITSTSVVLKWDKVFKELGPDALYQDNRGRKSTMSGESKKKYTRKPNAPLTREEELLAELEYLRTENAYLKKLNALVQEKRNSAKRNE